MKKRYHMGKTADGRYVFDECGESGGSRVVSAKQGDNLPNPDGPMYRVVPDGPGHVCLEEVTDHDGPSRVATESYRDGWDRVFGKQEAAGGMVN